ncbi:hypothetical protein F53441_13395 [Fusarium austroafricanum]|uniref:Uncharacterized protein n=1 Tax=Fusarium austroafricanum TaxID=2364996 RepID=A0A8H4NRE5_9HYPO|nr:hypothetical protein F53441_13395 [Fusarium austroafricanum]
MRPRPRFVTVDDTEHITPQDDHPEMSFRDSWILSKAVADTYWIQGHSYCSLDEAMTLANYLNKEMKVETAARSIAAKFLTPMTIVGTPTSVWKLLADTLMHFFDESCEMILELLLQMQKLSERMLPWSELPGFAYEWQRYYEHCRFTRQDDMTEEEWVQYRKQFYRNAGTFEARMLVLGIPGIDEHWAYRTINLISSREQDIDYIIYEIHAWLQVAGAKLAELLDPNQVKSFERRVRGRLVRHYELQVTMFEHWQHWKKEFLQSSYEEELSPDARELARDCHEMMKAQHIRLPMFLDTHKEGTCEGDRAMTA